MHGRARYGQAARAPVDGDGAYNAGNGASLNGGQYVWQFTAKQRAARLHPIKSGSDGSCGGSYLCQAGT
ncbi:MAG TPA: hypothetical protein VFU90_05815, partial [Candidatus Tumulicola sp.]|nr:hypothetical protein [Candidatus Tumulicola sp.]